MIVKQAVVLVGGRGTRLGSLAKYVPKPLLPIDNDHRFLDYLLENIARQGFSEILLVAGHLGDQIAARYGLQSKSFGSKLRVVIELAPQGTAGALVAIKHLLDSHFLLMNGDAFVDINLRQFERMAANTTAPAVIASIEMQDASRYGTLEVSAEWVLAFREKQPTSGKVSRINAGVYRLSREVVSMIEALPASIETNLFPRLAQQQQLAHIPVMGWFLDIGLPETLALARAEMPTRMCRPCVFFDRDNTLIIDRGYTYKVGDLEWMPGATSLIGKLNSKGYRVIVCTNQSGVARGYYSEDDVNQFHRAMQEDLAKSGAYIDKFFYCPYHPEAAVEKYRQAHVDRKPSPGMINRALIEWNIDKSRSLMIGDSETDIAAATAAGIPSLLFTGGNLQHFVQSHLEISRMITD